LRLQYGANARSTTHRRTGFVSGNQNVRKFKQRDAIEFFPTPFPAASVIGKAPLASVMRTGDPLRVRSREWAEASHIHAQQQGRPRHLDSSA
jgi:hypothetical protein